MITLDQLIASFNYISSVPYFLQSMGMITALAMIITVLLFDHNFKFVIKSFIAKVIFVLILLAVFYFRIQYSISVGTTDLNINAAQPLAGMITLGIVSLFWSLGVVLGTLIIQFQKRKALR